MRGFRKIEQGIRIDKSLKIQKANKNDPQSHSSEKKSLAVQ